MSKPLSPAYKGLITAALMIGVTFLLYTRYDASQPDYSAIAYTPYLLYAAGIIWTLVDYRRSPQFTGRFRDLFSQGFRCFIVVTLVMIIFWAIFLRVQPQYREEGAVAYREMLVNQKDKTPGEINDQVEQFKKQYNTGFISGSIFGYLIVGAAVTALSSVLLTRRNKNGHIPGHTSAG